MLHRTAADIFILVFLVFLQVLLPSVMMDIIIRFCRVHLLIGGSDGLHDAFCILAPFRAKGQVQGCAFQACCLTL